MKLNKKIICIYKIISPKGRIYIGQSTNFKLRMQAYKFMKKIKRYKDISLIHKSIIKYGFDNHTHEIIEYCNSEDLDVREEYWIEFYKSNIVKYPKNLGLNLCSGGVTKKEEFLDNVFRKDVVYNITEFSTITTNNQEEVLKTLFKGKPKSIKNYINRARLILTYINLYELLLRKPVTLNTETFAKSLGVNKSNMCYLMTELKLSGLLFKIRSHAISIRSSTYRTSAEFNDIVKINLDSRYLVYVNKIINKNMLQINEDIKLLFNKNN